MPKKKINGKEIKFRGLKRKEIRKLRKNGINLNQLKIKQVDDAMDAVLDMVLSDADNTALDDMNAKYSFQLWKDIMAETFGDPDAEKNSSGSGSGTQTPKE